jgi:hypothetical protein
MKPTIADAANTQVPAFLALKAKGFRVFRSKMVGTEEEWVAKSSEIKYVADDVLAFLGLVAMYEERGTNWKATDAQIEAFLKEFP